jgi:hypothetical protein
VRVELVDDQRAVEVARDVDPRLQQLAPHELAGGVARVRQQQRRQSAPLHLAAQIVRRERVAALGLEQDRDRRERAEDLEQLLVRGVVGQEVPEVDRPDLAATRVSAARPPLEMATLSAVYCEANPRR